MFQRSVSPSALLSVVMFGGCHFSANLDVNASELQWMEAEIHIVGLDNSGVHQLANYPASKYWSPGDQLRENALKSGNALVLNFGLGYSSTYVLNECNPAWQKWASAKAEYLMVIAKVQGVRPKGDRIMGLDPMCRIIPMGTIHKTSDIISVTPNGVFFLSPFD